MSISIHFSKKELLFFTAYFILGFADIVVANSYLFGDNRLKIYVVMLYLAAILAALAFCLEKYKIKDLIARLIIIFIGLLITAKIHVISFGISILIMVAASKIDPRKVIKICVINNLFFTVIVVVPALMGVIQNDVYNHNGTVAQCFGFQYYGNLPNLVLSIIFYSYVLACTKSKKFLVLCISLPIQLLLYRYCTVRLDFILYWLFLFLALVEMLYNKNTQHRFIKWLSTFMYPIAAVVTFVISLCYSHFAILTKLNEWCNYRFRFNAIGFSRYGLSLFGNKIETNSGTIDLNYINHYFYIDSGFVYAILCYGILFFALLIILYSLYSRNLAINNESELLVICVVICLYSVINNMLFSITINPLPILAFQSIINNRKNKGQSKSLQI